jgi:flagellar biosynthesis/type III secretory pathway M-ring protein FliF/YscJ
MNQVIKALDSGMPTIIIIVVLVAFFGLVVLLVILLKKHVPGLKNTEKPKSDKEIAREELDRILETVDEPLEEKKEEEPLPEESKEINDSEEKKGE